MKYADLIIPGGASNELARSIITHNLKLMLDLKKEKFHKLNLED